MNKNIEIQAKIYTIARDMLGINNEITQQNLKRLLEFICDEIGVINDFNNLVNSFEYYNCINSETGKYSAFYIPVCTVDRFTGEAPTPATLGTVEQYDYSYMQQ